MPYTIMVHGAEVTCATQEEVIALAKTLAGGAEPAPSRQANTPIRGAAVRAQTPSPTGAWVPPVALGRYFAGLKVNEQAVVRAIATARGEVDLDTLATVAGLEKRATSILLAACRTKAKSAGLDWDQITSHRIAGAREQRTSFYKPGPLLRGEAAQ